MSKEQPARSRRLTVQQRQPPNAQRTRKQSAWLEAHQRDGGPRRVHGFDAAHVVEGVLGPLVVLP